MRPSGVRGVRHIWGTRVRGTGARPRDEAMQAMTELDWEEVRGTLRADMGQANFAHFIQPLRFAGHDGEAAVFSTPSRFQSDWLANNYAAPILRAIRAAGHDARRVAFSVEGGLAAPAAAPAPVAAAPAGGPADLPGAPLDPRFTFDSFVTGRPNELAVAAARRLADTGEAGFNPLFLYGGVGLGKTHLMHAIAWAVRERDPGASVLYLSAERFMFHFVAALRERKMMDFKEAFRSVDLLMVDDVQFIAGKNSTQEEFFHTFNALVDQGKQIVISADRSPGEIRDLEDRIASRLQSGLVVDIHPTDYELRLSVLQAKAAPRCAEGGVEIAPGVLEYLAHRISTNVRVLEGSLNRLFAYQGLVGGPIDLDVVQRCLGDILRASDRKVSLAEIQRKVAEHYNIRLSELIGPRRTRNIARPRQVAMYLAKTLTQRSLPEIGRDFGGRDHTTILHGVRRIEELQAIDATIAEDVEQLRRALEA